MCCSLKKFQVLVLYASVWIYLLFNCFSRVKTNAFDRRSLSEKFRGMLYCLHVTLFHCVAKTCLQVRVLLVVCPRHALLFILKLVAVFGRITAG